MIEQLPWINIAEAQWMETHFALVQDINDHWHDDAIVLCQLQQIEGIKPGANPGGSPNGCE
jgi:hypothetical protein